jgi:hypothetical protein
VSLTVELGSGAVSIEPPQPVKRTQVATAK